MMARIERHPCPRCNSPLTSADKRNYLANGTVRLVSSCSKCHFKFTVGITTDNLDRLRKLHKIAVTKFEKETDKYGEARTSTQFVVKCLATQISEEKAKLGIE